jgi:hypothetical protein
MSYKNETTLERTLRILFGFSFLAWGFWISGSFWLSYTTPIYQVPCWNWSSFISHACLVERGFLIAVIGLISSLTGIIGWCPLKAILRVK